MNERNANFVAAADAFEGPKPWYGSPCFGIRNRTGLRKLRKPILHAGPG
jgi:hypothetical protein